MQIRLLDYKGYRATMESGMVDVTLSAEGTVDIWPYVAELVREGVVDAYLYEETLVKYVFRNTEGSVEHFLLPTVTANVFTVIVVALESGQVMGHYLLDINEQYGLYSRVDKIKRFIKRFLK